MRKFLFVALLCSTLFVCKQASAQDISSSADKVIDFPSSFFSKINNKTTDLEGRITRQTEKYLNKLARQERKIQKKLRKVDSAAAKQLFANSDQQYAQMIKTIKGDTLSKKAISTMAERSNPRSYAGEYMPYADSLKTSLAFLAENNSLLADSKKIKEKVQESLSNVNGLKSKLQKSEQVKAFIQNRKQQIEGGLKKYIDKDVGLAGDFNGYKQQAYYYSAQVKEYRSLLNDPDKAVEKGLSVISKVPSFQQFMSQHSELSALFPTPDNYGTQQALEGLQTRMQLQQQVQMYLASGGTNAQQLLQQNVQAAQAQIGQLKDKLNKIGNGGSSGDMELPDFKPNVQKTKSFWQRLEYGSNFQTAQASNFFPTTTDLGLSIGYKLNDKSTIGVGASYKIGWGTDISHIALSKQGAGLRSYIDTKLKRSFYASGGFEYNYQPTTVTATDENGTVESAPAWTQSGLLGISKIISVKSKFFKKTKIQLLWDFLSYQQTPRSQPIKFRVGYSF